MGNLILISNWLHNKFRRRIGLNKGFLKEKILEKPSNLIPIGLWYFWNSYKYDLIIGWSSQVWGYLYLKIQGQSTQNKQASRLASFAKSLSVK